MTAVQPKFHGVTLACDDSLTIQTHKVMLVDISTVSGGLLRNHPEPYPLVYVRGGGTSTQFEIKIDSKVRTSILWDCDKCGKHVRTKDVS